MKRQAASLNPVFTIENGVLRKYTGDLKIVVILEAVTKITAEVF